MKAFLGTLGFLGGFFVSLGMFVVGVVTATWFLAAEPIQQAAQASEMDRLWTVSPRKVDVASQNLERLPPTNPAPTADPAVPQGIDTTTTASVQPEPAAGENDLRSDVNFAAHVEWCERRYRSYRPNDNSYTSYDGDDRPCVSPYSQDLLGSSSEETASVETGEGGYDGESDFTQYASDQSGISDVDANHVSDCFARYRSYDPADNSYQPFGGGPRQQCY